VDLYPTEKLQKNPLNVGFFVHVQISNSRAFSEVQTTSQSLQGLQSILYGLSRSELAKRLYLYQSTHLRMLHTTTSVIEGKKITSYKGLVTGEVILGANIFKDFMAGIRDIVGGRSGSYERTLREARQSAVKEMEEAAAALGANAIVGIDIDYETIGKAGSMLMVSVSGTAVVVEND
jgi:uncharacterized protein YbjQ (UPF0145 family)